MKNKKRMLIALAMVFMIIFNTVPVFANNDITVCIDGQNLWFDVPPQIIDGRTMVPMRKIFEALGATVTWDDSTKTATGAKGDTIVNVSIDSKILFKNGVPKTLDVAPALIDSRTLVPARAIAESFDCEVNWIAETRTVYISTSAPKTPMTASEISEELSDSVFYIEVYDKQVNPLGSGSGFFITNDGVAVTNYHVIDGSYYASITTVDGSSYLVSEVLAYDEELDVAILRIDKTSLDGIAVPSFPVVTLADSDNIKAGQNVFTIGSPQGLQNTISSGIISNVKQIVGGQEFIQITAPISHGSSGGALINEYGEVLGITSAGITEAENIGFAIPINVIKSVDLTAEGVPYSDFISSNSEFILEIYPETIEIEVGEKAEIYVYAEGSTDDWSIYWDTEQESLIKCEWGDWLEENSSICPLTITGLKKGVAVVTIYSDVDFKGKDVVVYVNEPKIANYPGTSIPDYTSVTGMSLVDYAANEQYKYYKYNLYHHQHKFYQQL